MSCRDCIVTSKCCGKFFADGQCCNQGEAVTVPCPQHAIAEFVIETSASAEEREAA